MVVSIGMEKGGKIAFADELNAQNTDGLLGFFSFKEDQFGKIHMKGEFLDGDLLKISVLAEDLESPVLGLAFHLNYEGSKLAFLRYVPGTFLERGGDPFYLVSKDAAKEKLIFGETLRREDSFPLGGGQIVDFYFQIIEESSYNFKFDRAVVSILDTVRQDLDKVEWQDLILDREHPEGIIENDSGDFGRELNSSGIAMATVIKMALLGSFSACAAAYLILMIRNREEKRHS